MLTKPGRRAEEAGTVPRPPQNMWAGDHWTMAGALEANCSQSVGISGRGAPTRCAVAKVGSCGTLLLNAGDKPPDYGWIPGRLVPVPSGRCHKQD